MKKKYSTPILKKLEPQELYYVFKKTPFCGKVLFSANGIIPYSTLIENAKEYSFGEAKKIVENISNLQYINCLTLHERAKKLEGHIEYKFIYTNEE